MNVTATTPSSTDAPATPDPADVATQESRRDALADRLVAGTVATLELFSVHLGRELGLYAALAEDQLTYLELAEHAGIAPRYAREWLEQQAVAGLLEVATAAGGDAEHRRYRITAGHAPVLLEADDASHVAPLADMVAGVAGVLADLPRAYRSGGGVPYAEYGSSFRRGQAGVNRPAFANDLSTWMQALPDITVRLASDPIGRIADIGCGEGWSSIALAREFPQACVDGYDSDPASVQAASQHAVRAGLSERVSFHLVDAADITGPYDLALVFEVLHDLARPRDVLAGLRSILAENGALLVADERVAATFTAPGDEIERLMYGWSVTHCLPASLADTPSVGLGTVLRASTVHALAEQAGFSASTELPLHNDFFRFYRLDP